VAFDGRPARGDRLCGVEANSNSHAAKATAATPSAVSSHPMFYPRKGAGMIAQSAREIVYDLLQPYDKIIAPDAASILTET
jgi:hypothetical protein